MARKRMIDPNIWESEDFSKLSMLGKVLFIGLFSIADDEGRGKANPAYIRSKLFPYTADDVRLADIKNALLEIAQRMSATFYTVNGSQYYALTHWELWQKIDRPSPSTIPAPEDGEVFDEDSTKARRTIGEDSFLIEKNRKEKNRTEIEREAHTPKTVEDVIAYSNVLGGGIPRSECEKFYDYFSSNGWKVAGKTPMKDWKAAFRNWVRNVGSFGSSKKTVNYAQHQQTDADLNHLLVNLDA